MSEVLEGKKTYLVALGIILTGIGSYLSGDVTLIQAVVVILNGLGLGALRLGVANN